VLPYDGMTRTGSKGMSHPAIAETPSWWRKVLQTRRKIKFSRINPLPAYSGSAVVDARAGLLYCAAQYFGWVRT